MHEKLHSLLGAYMDDELHGRQLLEVEQHLATCETCQSELHELEQISTILHSVPEEVAMPSRQFTSRLMLALPRQEARYYPLAGRTRVWWLIPAILIGGWFFIQVVFTLANLVSAADASGLLGQATAWLGGTRDASWISVALSIFGGQLATSPVLSSLDRANLIGKDLLTGFLWQALVAILYLVWLISWWRGGRVQPSASNAE
jgi:anti-sigma factor RsiW